MKISFFSLLLSCLFLFSCSNNKLKDCDYEPVPHVDRGCDNFLVFTTYGNDSTFLKVFGDRDELMLTETEKEFDLALNPAFQAEIEVYNAPGKLFCTDAILVGLEVTNTFTAISGKVRVSVVREATPCDETYVIDLSLENAVFEDAAGNQITVQEQVFDNVYVNYLIG